MSVTLPPLPDAEYNLGSEFERTDAYSGLDMIAYALAAVEAYRASRVPMTPQQVFEFSAAWDSANAESTANLIRAVEKHHGIGAEIARNAKEAL